MWAPSDCPFPTGSCLLTNVSSPNTCAPVEMDLEYRTLPRLSVPYHGAGWRPARNLDILTDKGVLQTSRVMASDANQPAEVCGIWKCGVGARYASLNQRHGHRLVVGELISSNITPIWVGNSCCCVLNLKASAI